MAFGRHAKAEALALAIAVLTVEGYFVYRYYDRYYGYDAAVGGSAAFKGTTFGGTSPDETQGARVGEKG